MAVQCQDWVEEDSKSHLLACLDGVRPLTTDAEHVDGSLVQLDEHAVVDLPQTEQLQNLLHLGGHLRKKVLKVCDSITILKPYEKDILWVMFSAQCQL